MRVVFGLGNPGPQYVITRHNAGFLVADALVQGWELPAFQPAGNSLISRAPFDDNELVIVKPLTFMNLSGEALHPFLDTPDFAPSRDLLVISDDFAIPLGTYRLRGAGSSGGHNGLQSIERTVGSQDYPRLRIGIGPLPEGRSGWTDFVLAPFSSQELDTLSDLLPELADAVDCWMTEGIEIAMSRFNKRLKTEEDSA